MNGTKILYCAALVAIIPAIAHGQPLLRYSFDEASGDALDTGSAPLTNATLEGGATRSTDTPSGSGFSLDLRNDATYAHALEGDADDLDGLSALTLTTWLKVEDYTSGNNRLSAKQAAGTFGGFSWNMNATTNDGDVGPDNFRLGLFLGNNVSSGPADFGLAFSDADVDAADKWVFLAVTYDNSLASENTAFYIGGLGAPVTQLGTTQTIAQLTIEGGTSLYGVGYTDAAPTADTSVTGWQDDVRVYGSVLSPTELDDIRLANVPEPASLTLMMIASLVLLRRRQVNR